MLKSNMAAGCEGVSLKEVFDQGFLLHSQLEDDDEPSSSEVFQVYCFFFLLSILMVSKFELICSNYADLVNSAGQCIIINIYNNL